jgi:hypothetical protein
MGGGAIWNTDHPHAGHLEHLYCPAGRYPAWVRPIHKRRHSSPMRKKSAPVTERFLCGCALRPAKRRLLQGLVGHEGGDFRRGPSLITSRRCNRFAACVPRNKKG